ncbi:MAG: hypothetical protein AAGA90_20400 [Actinomycetota bacterium]
MPTFITRLATVCAVGGLTLGLATPALAQTDDTDEGRDPSARCQTQIERRLGDLATAQSRVAGVEALTDAHEATINAIIDATEAGLADQSVAIAEASDRETLATLCAEIATEFRVYLVVLPQTHLTVGADRVDQAVERGEALIARLDEAIAAADAAGADIAAAQALRDEAAAHLAAAEATVDGVGDTVLTVTPASWNDGDGAAVIEASRTAVRSAHGEITAGIEDGRDAVEAIRAALDAVAT